MNTLSRQKNKNPIILSVMRQPGRPATTPRTEFGQRLYNARIAAGLTQNEIAEKFGVTQAFVAFWERKGKSLPADLLKKLSELYNVSVDKLVGKESVNQPKLQSRSARLTRCFERASKLSRRQQEKIAEVIDALVDRHEKKHSNLNILE